MHIVKLLIGITILLTFQIASGEPEYEIIKSCRDRKPVNSSVTITKMEFDDIIESPKPDCENKYLIHSNNQILGVQNCYDSLYFFIGNNTFLANSAADVMKNPEQKPGDLISQFSMWSQIKKDGQTYLCITSPVAENGAAAAYWQYYIIENAFDSKSPIKVYYYFFGFKK